MALATLCADVKQPRSVFRPKFHAFVVDHGARSGSRNEAEAVAARLQDLGLRSTILTLRWPLGVRPAELSNFETQARRLRYRALGVACRNRKIRSLILAHHADDQAELMLMKIAQLGQHSRTSRPMAGSHVNLPETWGMYGIHESGLQEYQDTILRLRRESGASTVPPFPQVPPPEQPSRGKDGLRIEDGGVKLYRPLLQFSKKSLEATCLQHGVAWFEDETNRDVTLTPRNAVRSLLEQRKLPGPLSRDALLQLMSSIENKHTILNGHAEALFRRTKILTFDLRSGRLIVRLPRLGKRLQQRIPQTIQERGRAKAKIRAAMLLKKLVSLVTPKDCVLLSGLVPMVDCMFPYLVDLDHQVVDEALAPAKMTFQGVLVERVKIPLEPTSSDVQPENTGFTDSESIWSFTRQPYPRVSARPQITILPQRSPTESYLHGQRTRKYNGEIGWSQWQLWDGRYWIRVFNKTDKYLNIRSLIEADMARIKEKLPHDKFEKLRKTLAAAAPGVVRWTLPVIAEEGDLGEVLALPSLKFSTYDRPVAMLWEIRYKHVNLGPTRDESCIIR
ncbi:MAG: hypothetical protein Q9191_000510 [Dirinaria sp. TL-2023a]